MSTVLIATDSNSVFEAVDSALADSETSVIRVRAGQEVMSVLGVRQIDLIILDLQIGNMGGVATCIAIRQEQGFDRLYDVPVALLLDRDADRHMAEEADADGWLVKPLNPIQIRKLATGLLNQLATP
jgi:DNA-binding response OmpR family regulator